MNKAELMKLAENFYQQAFEANSYYLILKQYSDNYKEYVQEL